MIILYESSNIGGGTDLQSIPAKMPNTLHPEKDFLVEIFTFPCTLTRSADELLTIKSRKQIELIRNLLIPELLFS